MRRYYCDRCKLEIEKPDTDLLRIEIQRRRFDSCSRSPCVNAFNDMQMRIDAYARKNADNVRIFMDREFVEFFEGANTYGEPQEAANSQ